MSACKWRRHTWRLVNDWNNPIRHWGEYQCAVCGKQKFRTLGWHVDPGPG